MLRNLPKLVFQKGQALLIVLLSMAAILTVVLSVISRSATDISFSSLDENALRAFSAAEAGVERALIVGTDVSESVGDSSFTAAISGLAENTLTFAYPTEIYSGESVYIWLVSHEADGTLACGPGATNPCFTGSSAEICWGSGAPSGNNQTPAVEVSVFYDASAGQTGVNSNNFSQVRVARAAFDPWAGRTPPNNFNVAAGTCIAGSTTFDFSDKVAFNSDADASTVDLGISCIASPGCLLAIRVRPLYNTGQTQPIGINVSGDTLPGQGRVIESTGTSGGGASVRKVEAFRTFGGPPPIFDASVFSIQSIVK